MNWLQPDRLKELLIELCAVPSLSNTPSENSMVEVLGEVFKRIPFFEQHPENIMQEKMEKDPYNREVFGAFLPGRGPQTVILLSHYDVVDVLDYGRHQDLAFSPQELTQEFLQREEIRALIPAGQEDDFLFGRGTADMKAGLALQIALLNDLSPLENREGNILLLSVPDEETTSRGMLTAVKFLNRLRREKGLEYRGVINCEPAFPAYPGDKNRYIYTGSMGKAVLFCYARGIETHVGDVLSGFNANLLIAELIRDLEGNIELCEELEGYVAPPPTFLKSRDNKRHYSAQIPHTAACYLNFSLLYRSPRELLQEVVGRANRIMDQLTATMDERLQKYLGWQGQEPPQKKREGWVLTYQEFYNLARKKSGNEVEQALIRFFEDNHHQMEEQELCLRITEIVDDYAQKEGPGLIVGFTPPYYPPVKSDAKSERDRAMIKVAEGLQLRAREKHGYQVKLFPFFPGISDLNYCQLSDYQDTKDYFKPNMPTWSQGYTLPLDDLREIDIPVINISVQGYDAHKHTERLECHYSFGVTPDLLRQAVQELLQEKD